MARTMRSRPGTCACVALAVFVVAAVAPPAHADHADRTLGFFAGGALGGALGSLIGSGSGREIAIGVGSTLGALYGYEAARKAHPRERTHAHRRSHGRKWAHAPHRSRWEFLPRVPGPRWTPHRQRWAPAYVAPVLPVVQPVYVPPPVPAYQPVYVAPAVAAIAPVYAARGVGPGRRTATECRTLQEGTLPVYACTDGAGDWWLLK